MSFAATKGWAKWLGKRGCPPRNIVVIEHNLDVIKTADWLVDMGPEGGSGGGTVVAQGTPEQVAAVAASYTGGYLKRLLS